MAASFLPQALRTLVSAILPNATERFHRRRMGVACHRDLHRVLELTEQRYPAPAETLATDAPGPVFLLSAGWRSGSTLVQRLVSSASGTLLWGEPYHHCAYIQRLAAALKPFTELWPSPEMLLDSQEAFRLSDSWIANLYPAFHDMRLAHRAFLDALLYAPAMRRGYNRWGLKEVRFGRDEIAYLRWLYPNARFVLLVRNPRHAWRSYRGKIWYISWPDRPVYTAATFARVWRALAADFLIEAAASDTLLVRYEDLLQQGDTVAALEAHLNLQIDRSVLDNRISGMENARKPPPRSARVEAVEDWLIGRLTGPVARRLDYR
ncbi:MAG TPA: sulfotransferase [Nitrococcus sp.]|nr:sulfotransferase [Nitrococcus sp.]